MVAKSDLLRVRDVRDAYRLIGECRDLGSDPALWQPRLLEGLCTLIGGPSATGGEGLWLRPNHPVRVLSVYQAGFDARSRQLYAAFHRELGPAREPIFCALQRIPGQLVTRSRRQVLSDAEWYGSYFFNEYQRPVEIEDRLQSVYQVSQAGAVSVLVVHRAPGERRFSSREARLLNFVHDELGRLIGHALASIAEPSPANLSPRLRQTLACLLDGDGEKQVAARLGLSRATIHQYVTMLYRHFKVGSRAQLLTHVLKRGGRDRWEAFRSEPGKEL
jgi:DNA-binding CsgD family transcriptional regulator